VTDAPPKFRGDVHVAYGGDFEQVGLEEGTQTYGIRNTTRHDLGLRFEVAVWEGVLVHIGLPITIQQRIAFPAAREMLFEPVTGEGSYENGQPIDASPIVSGGLQGAWFGVGAIPFSKRYARTLPVEMRFDISVRTGGRFQTLYGASRGGSPGGAALRIAGALSKQVGIADSYVSFSYQHEFAANVDVVDNDGTIWSEELRIRPAGRLDAVIGTEIVAMEKADKSSRFAVDVHAAIGYRSWEDRASGFWLPSVLEPSRTVTVTMSDYVQLGVGAGIDYHLNRWLGLRMGAEGRYFTPRTVESTYSVRTDGPSFGVNWWAALVGRVRLKNDP
jgi:hypothetical protein